MPVLAVAGIAAGGAALATGTLTIMQTVAAIGSIVGGIGALTDSKELMAIGAVAGLAGGIGAFAQSQGWLQGAEAVSNTEAIMRTPAPNVDVANAVADFGEAAGSNAVELGQTPMQQTANLDSGIQQSITQANPLVQETSLFNSPPPVSDLNTNAKDILLARGDVTSPLGTADDGGIFGTLKSVSKWMNENKELTSLLGNFVGGAFDSEKKAKAAYYQTAADAAKRKAANANAVPTLGLKLKPTGPVFPSTAPTYTPVQVGGLFNAG